VGKGRPVGKRKLIDKRTGKSNSLEKKGMRKRETAQKNPKRTERKRGQYFYNECEEKQSSAVGGKKETKKGSGGFYEKRGRKGWGNKVDRGERVCPRKKKENQRWGGTRSTVILKKDNIAKKEKRK